MHVTHMEESLLGFNYSIEDQGLTQSTPPDKSTWVTEGFWSWFFTHATTPCDEITGNC